MVNKLRHKEFIGYQVYTTQRALARSLDSTLAPLRSHLWSVERVEPTERIRRHDPEGTLGDPQEGTCHGRKAYRQVGQKGTGETHPPPRGQAREHRRHNAEAAELLEEAEPHVADQADFIAQGISDADLNVFFDVLNTVRENAVRTVEDN